MPRISTDNYDTVASWNGSQDLFVVEQPDGTKVATPAMVKQFIEAGDFVATGEIEDGHGNILKDMAKSDEIGDLSQTGLTGDSVADQLGTAGEQIANVSGAIDSLTGGKVSRCVAQVPDNHSVKIALSGSYSSDAEFALVAFNVGGNALAGFELLALGRGTAKIKALIGAMPTTQYTASYDSSSKKWTITNKCGSTVMVTVMLSKGKVEVV